MVAKILIAPLQCPPDKDCLEDIPIMDCIKKDSLELFCETDGDCACGTHKDIGDCFHENKDYVILCPNMAYPNFCFGITEGLITTCMNNKCTFVDLSI